MKNEFICGDVINHRYEVYGVKKGSFGVVYLVFDIKDKSPYALKTFSAEKFKTFKDLNSKFEKECSNWIKLDQHPNIVEAFFFTRFGSTPYILIEYLPGGDLRELLNKHSIIDDPHLLFQLLFDFCKGMEFLTVSGLKYHGDIKPENLMLTENRRLKITDFGFSKMKNSIIEEDRQVEGTLPYMAPECFKKHSIPNISSDIYAFGIILFEIVTGTLPFNGIDFDSFNKSHNSVKLPHFKCERNLKKIIRKCLEKNISKRYQNIAELEKDGLIAFSKRTNENYPLKNDSYETQISFNQMLSRSSSLIELGHFEEAIIICNNIIEDSDDPEVLSTAWNNIGWAKMELNEKESILRQGVHYFNKAVDLNPYNYIALHNMGLLYRKMGELELAVNHYKKALEIRPTFDRSWVNLAYVFRIESKLELAIECYSKALQVNHLNPTAHLSLYEILIEEPQNRKRAIDHLQMANELQPWDPTIILKLTNEYIRENSNHDYCKNMFNRLCELDIDRVVGKIEFANLGAHIYNSVDSYEDAYRYSYQAIQNKKYDDVTLLELASSIKGLNNPSNNINQTPVEISEDLITLYNDALRLNPNNSEAYRLKGIALTNLSQLHEAKNCFAKSISLNPNDEECLNDLGIVLIRLEEFSNGRLCYSEAIKNSPKNERFYYNLADSYIETKEFEKAIEYFEKATELKINYPEAWQSMGLCYRNLNNFEMAHYCFDQTILIAPLHKYVHYNKASVFLQAQEYDKALECISQSIKVNKNDQSMIDKALFLRKQVTFLLEILKPKSD